MSKTKIENSAADGAGKVRQIVRLFIVVWDDEMGVCVPMTRDADCAGALCAAGVREKIALFSSRKAARSAINISTKFAHLRQAQGKPVNTDFLGNARKNLHVVECEPNNADEVARVRERNLQRAGSESEHEG